MRLFRDVTGWLRGRRELIVSAGRVACPNRGDVDVDACTGCPFLDRADPGAVPATIHCAVVRDAVTVERAAFLAW